METPTDPLKEFEKYARENLSSNRVDLRGLDQARAHQRGENVGKPVTVRSTRFTKAQIRDMMTSEDNVYEVADRNNASHITVRNYRRRFREGK